MTRVHTPTRAGLIDLINLIDAPQLIPLGPGARPKSATPAAPVPVPVIDRWIAMPGAAALALTSALTSDRSRPANPAHVLRAHVLRSATLPESVGALSLKDAAAFAKLAKRVDVPGASKVLALKFLMVGVDTDKPVLYLINSQTFDYHYEFFTQGLGHTASIEEFNRQTYFRDQRQNVAGTVVFYESYVNGRGKKGAFTLDFWPTDLVKAPTVAKVFRALKKALPFAASRIAYHPMGNSQEALLDHEAAQFKALRIKSIRNGELFANQTYAALNMGEGFGVLRVLDGTAARPATARDIVVFKGTPPNELSHVSGIITESPQTPLSHVNLKARQNGTPNAYIKGASTDATIAALVGKVVRFHVGPEGYALRLATQAEADAFLEKVRPKAPQKPPRSLSKKHPAKLSDLSFGQANIYGAKATNVAELGKILPSGMVPDGYGLPFYFYDQFMKQGGFYDEVRTLLADPKFISDATYREQALTDLRKKIKKAKMPDKLALELTKLQADLAQQFGKDTPIRCRSSTNNEDLPGFNGAGLYDSFTHRSDEGDLQKTIKQVFASMWNFRAFEEREFYRIDHLTAAMGVLLHPNEDDEQANGVAYTKNIVDPNWPGFYVNAQVGEELVTNPGASVTPDELLVSRIGQHGELETQFISRSNQTKDNQPVLGEAKLGELVAAMELLHAHFQPLYRRQGDKSFAMDIEFKVRKDGSLQIKQARPTVD